MPSILRFLHQYLRPTRGAVIRREVGYRRGEERIEATLVHPAGARADLPGWVVLHGLTHTGRHHPELVRFVDALAAAGTAVLVPDIPEWRELWVRPAVTVPTIAAAVLAMEERPEVRPGHLGLLGFSFGATQGLVAAADPRLDGHLQAVVAWGGYRDPRALFRFGLTGRHELDGRAYHIAPDPYGRWIMGANYLTTVPGYAEHEPVARALMTLAREAGRSRKFAGGPALDPVKVELRRDLSRSGRDVFDLFAPIAGEEPADAERAGALADALAAAAVREEPLMEPGLHLPHIRERVLLAHGLDDRLVPFTETLRLARDLPPDRLESVTVTRLFAHSGGADRSLGMLRMGREALRFIRVLRSILRLV